MLHDRMKLLRPIPVLLFSVSLSLPAVAQEAGWHYSPLPGEGDRASLGCAPESTPESFACVAVRCEDDYSTGIHIHTSRPEGDVGEWLLTIDRENLKVETVASDAPYGAQIVDETEWLLERLKQGTFVYLQPETGTQPPTNPVSLAGSLYAINSALTWCAPRLSPVNEDADEPTGAPSVQ